MFYVSFQKFIALFLLVTFCASPSFAASEQPSPGGEPQAQPLPATPDAQQEKSVKLNKEYFIGYWTDTKNILTAPARWDSSDWIEASAIIGISVGLFTQDDQIQTWVQKHKNDSTSHLADDAKKIGTFSIPAVVGLGLYGYVAKDVKAERTFLLTAESFIVTGAFVQVLKRTTGRNRPYTGASHDTWSGPSISGNNDHLSFPSGDASSAFAIASVIASEYDNWIVPPLVYTASTAIALERVHNNAHWSSDVFIGSAIGYFTGKAIVASHRDGSENRVSLIPVIDGSEKGAMLTYRF